MKYKLHIISFLAFVISYTGCKPDPIVEPTITQDKTPFLLDFQGLPPYDIPTDNVLTVQGVQLGRMLFYEKSLSKDGSQACVTCHVQSDGFSDKNQFSLGVEKKLGGRQAMPIFNMGYHKIGFFWDGRATTLREQSLKPIQDALEMNETLPNVITKLSANKTYRDQFTRVFGDATITSERMSLAMEQFMMTLISGNSKYDQVQQGKAQFTDEEARGKKLFFTEFDPTGKVKGAECFHCHAGPNFSNSEMQNNGLDTEANWKDLGRFKVTNDPTDKAKFKTPSLRNIAVTAPYMHDGRFNTLEEVIEHYNLHVKKSATLDELMQYNIQPGGLALSTQDKQDLIAFLKTLTDNTYLNNTAYKSPF
jgi:cytochrome c peroxidase